MEPGSLLTMSFGFLYITHLPKMEKLVLQIALRVVEILQKLIRGAGDYRHVFEFSSILNVIHLLTMERTLCSVSKVRPLEFD